MFNGILKSDDVDVLHCSNGNGSFALTPDCKSNILIANPSVNSYSYVDLPDIASIGKIINITVISGVSGIGKTMQQASLYIRHSDSTLFTLKQGTVSFMYVGQQLNGLTTTDKAKSGWIILGGVQGDTAITGYAGSVAIGSGAHCTNTNSVAVGTNSIGGSYAIAIGSNAYTSALYSMALGVSSQALQQYSAAIGYSAYSQAAKLAIKTNSTFSANGDAQAGKFILMRQTTDATPTVLTATNAAASTSNILILPNNGTYAFKGIVVAKDATTGDSAMWEVTALIRRGANASTTAIVGTPTITKVFADTGASAWTISLTADTTNGGGAITVTGEAGKTIRWVSNIDSAEVI